MRVKFGSEWGVFLEDEAMEVGKKQMMKALVDSKFILKTNGI